MKTILCGVIACLTMLLSTAFGRVDFSVYVVPGTDQSRVGDVFYLMGEKPVDMIVEVARQSVAYPHLGDGPIKVLQKGGEKPEVIATAKPPAGARNGVIVVIPQKNGGFKSKAYWFKAGANDREITVANFTSMDLGVQLQQKGDKKKPDPKRATGVKAMGARALKTPPARNQPGNFNLCFMSTWEIVKLKNGKPMHLTLGGKKVVQMRKGQGAALLMYESSKRNIKRVLLNAEGGLNQRAAAARDKQIVPPENGVVPGQEAGM